jgi:O-antigen ligase
LFGSGVGDLKSGYVEIYNKYNLDWALENDFNAHNMYVEIYFGIGLLGLLTLLTIFIFGFKRAINNSAIHYVIFLILFALAGITESLLNRQYGIVFFALFNTVIFFKSINSGQ